MSYIKNQKIENLFQVAKNHFQFE